MNIIYTHDIFTSQKFGGISRYFSELIKRVSLEAINVQVLAGLYNNEYIRGLPGVKGFKVPSINHTGFIRQNISEVYQQFMLRNSTADTIIHQTYYLQPYVKCKGKRIVTVYDMVHELFPQCLPAGKATSRLKRLCCERTDKIIAISHSTKNDLVRLFGIDPENIIVIHLGTSIKGKNAYPGDNFFPERYLLYVGARSGYKNFEGLLHAFAASNRLKEAFHIVCFGSEAFSCIEKETLNKLRVDGFVHQVNGDDEMLANFYRHAEVFVYPSLYEGFGIPLLEAMSLSCPVICSNTSSIPEVVGDAGIYFDPHDISSIRNALEDTLFNESLLSDLKKRGLQRGSKFSWEKCASETVAVYRSLLS